MRRDQVALLDVDELVFCFVCGLQTYAEHGLCSGCEKEIDDELTHYTGAHKD